jgi:hypothetical protein
MALFENPKLAGYVFNSLLNKVPFVDRDKQEERAYLGARAEGLDKIYGKPGMSDNLLEAYDTGQYQNAEEGVVDWLLNQGYGLPSAIKTPRPQVKGIADEYTLPEPQEQPIQQVPLEQQPQQGWFETYQIPQIEGRQPIEDIVVPDEVINTFVENARKYAGTPHQSASLPYRKEDTVAENAEYVAKYVEAAMRLAPYFDLPPKTIAAMLMEESGWGGQRFNGNLGGYGFLDSGEDMGIRFDAPTVEEQAAKYLEKVATDWDGRYQGSRSPQDFHEKGYNPHASYPGRVMDVYRMLEAQ